MSDPRLLGLIAAWVAYFIVHSALASLPVKRWVARHWPGLMPAYRIFFNFVAVAGLLVPLWLTFAIGGEWVIRWRGLWWWLVNGLAVLALLGFFWSLRYYDGAEFIGLRQLREREQRVEEQERFRISPLHRHVRHPWYFLGLVLLWSRDMTPAMLVSVVMMTLYFAIGSRLEERKLISYYGEAYRQYRQRVPGLVPLPGRSLSKREARELERRGNEAS